MIRIGLICPKRNFGHATIGTLRVAIVIIGAFMLYAKLVQSLDDAMIAGVLTLTALLAVIPFGGPSVRNRR
ncbi:hypothetical protein IFT67_19850 [Sphingomonas sp. CFBP 13728]|uniref:hypothetical protein n=1 Tax=Sphingomonas sp. CFBP 13728 TaxID=2775294 RepID=UPI001782BA71|nr:hypothetical protein [Sphingomonas sp. CFBP 13728]MBD8621166.1 hypothetical protein [Sphingomonas sp. CFBP 13728]